MIQPDFISVLAFLWYYLGIFIFIMLTQNILGDVLKKTTDNVLHHSLRSFLFGVVFFIGVPIVALLSIITLFGIPLGLMVLLVYIILVLLSVFVSAVSVANWINKLGNFNLGFWALTGFALIIFLLINLLLMVPLIGWFVLGIISCLSFGSILFSMRINFYSAENHVLW